MTQNTTQTNASSNVIVVDSIMGSGKSSWAIQTMNDCPNESYIYATPFLDEVERVKSSCNRNFYDPKRINGRKIDGFNHLLIDGRDIVLTHATFANANDDTLEYIANGEYTLILDEVLDILVNFNDVATNCISKADITMLLNEGFIQTDEYGKVRWCKSSYPGAKYYDVERLAKAGCLFYLDKTMLVWQFPPQIFSLFKKVYILTYLFRGSMLAPYLEYHGIPYEYRSVEKSQDGRYKLVSYSSAAEEKRRIKSLITILDNPKLNDYRASALCSTWYKNADKKSIDRLQKNLFNYFHNLTKAKASEIMWTCPKDFQKHLKGKGYTSVRRLTADENKLPSEELEALKKRLNCFLPCNMRASNDYRERRVLAYLCNMYVNPYVDRYFKNKNTKDGTNIGIDRDYYALATMLQWVWRSCIRDDKPIEIYIPSTRIRTLFMKWLDDEM